MKIILYLYSISVFSQKKRAWHGLPGSLGELAQRPKSLAGVWYEEINCISMNSVVEPRIYTISYQTTPRHYYLLLQCMFSLPMAPSSYITCILPSWSSEVGSFWDGGLPGSLREPGRRAWQDFGEPGNRALRAWHRARFSSWNKTLSIVALVNFEPSIFWQRFSTSKTI